MKSKLIKILSVFLFGILALTASGCGSSDSDSGPVLTEVRVLQEGTSVPAVPVGVSVSYTAEAVYDNGEVKDITAVAVWSSSDENIVTMGTGAAAGKAVTVAPGTVTITVSYEEVNATTVLNVASARLERIVVNAGTTSLIVGVTTQMSARGIYSDQMTYDLTQDVVWSSSDDGIVALDGSTARGMAAGQAVVTATFGSVTGALDMTVQVAQLTALHIVGDDHPGDEFVVGETVRVRALADFNNGVRNRDVTDKVTWTTGPEGTVSVENGLITALKPGAASVSARYKGEFGEANDTITGTVVEKTMTQLLIFSDPENAAVPAGLDIRLEAWAKYNDGTTLNVSDTVKWTSDDPKVTVEQVKGEKHVYATANETVSATVEALHADVRARKTVAFTEKVADHIEIQESYCENGDCPVITGKTVEIPIVDDVNYDPVSEGAYYPTAWLVYSDGSKAYINTERGINWWSTDQVRAYVNTIRGSFVFGRGVGSGIEISVSYRGEYKTSFFVDVKEDTTEKTLTAIGLKNTKDLGWGCTQNDADYGTRLTAEVGDGGKYVMACGKFEYKGGAVRWEDINNNVAWFSSDAEVARVRTATGEFKALGEGNAVISAQLAEIKGSIDVAVTAP